MILQCLLLMANISKQKATQFVTYIEYRTYSSSLVFVATDRYIESVVEELEIVCAKRADEFLCSTSQ